MRPTSATSAPMAASWAGTSLTRSPGACRGSAPPPPVRAATRSRPTPPPRGRRRPARGRTTRSRAGREARGSSGSPRGASPPRRTPRRRSPSPSGAGGRPAASPRSCVDRVGPGARERLVRRDPHAPEPRSLVQRRERHRERDRAAVRVRDDPVVLEGPLRR